MPFLAPFIPYIIGAAAVVGATATVVSASKSGSEAKKAGAESAKRQTALEASLANRQGNEESDANKLATRDAARRRQASLAASATGRGDTILTSPLGDTGQTSTGQKTLLGT